MSKRIEQDGKFYRKRRGQLVEIPDKWVGQIPTKQTIRKRKEAAKLKKSRKAHIAQGQPQR